jgi:RNA polymerase sigma-70 factor (ECF subfamily)
MKMESPKNGGSDAELIARYLSGDGAAFEILYEKYKRQLYSYIRRLLSGRDSPCDDIFQQTWIKAIANFANYKESERFLAWIMRISHNLAMDYFRKYSKEDLDDFSSDKSEMFSTFDSPWRQLHRKELVGAIDECAAKLPLEQREVFLFRADDIAFKDIAEIQNCSINTVLARMHYAIKSLRNCLRVHYKIT